MADIKLFTMSDSVQELPSHQIALEKDLQNLIEANMEEFFGVTFLQAEYVTSNGGRIDSLGIDENHCPVILEYKRSINENVINQGLFYLDWLMDHKAEFELLVMNQLGKKYSDLLDWSIPRVICIANSFTRYDEYAVNQINRNIDLVRYIVFDKKFILFEMVNSKSVIPSKERGTGEKTKKSTDKTFDEQFSSADPKIQSLYDSIKDYILSLGDDITEKKLKLYFAFKKIKNVACLEMRNHQIMLYLKLDPNTLELEKGFSRDVSNIGHWGTGDLEIVIKNDKDFEKAKPLINRTYEEN